VKSFQSHLDGSSTDVSIDFKFGLGLPSTTEDYTSQMKQINKEMK